MNRRPHFALLAFLATASLTAPSLGQGLPHIFRVDAQDSSTPADDSSDFPAISGDGNWVVFTTGADNLVPPAAPTSKLVLKDLSTGAFQLAGVLTDGTPANVAGHRPAALSHDGRYIAFTSATKDTTTGDPDNLRDVFLFDRTTGASTLLSTLDLAPFGDSCLDPDISADGNWVSWNLEDGQGYLPHSIQLLDRSTGTVRTFSANNPATGGFSRSELASDGSKLFFFESFGPPGTQSPPLLHVYDIATDTLGSLPGIQPANGVVSVDKDGTHLAFRGKLRAPYIVGERDGAFVVDTVAGTFESLNPIAPLPQPQWLYVEVSGDGRYATFVELGQLGGALVYRTVVRDLEQGVSTIASINDSAQEAVNLTFGVSFGFGTGASLSHHGERIVFASNADNLALPTNPGGPAAAQWRQIFVRELTGGAADVTLSAFTAGAPTTLAVTGASPNALVMVGLTTAGQRPTPTPFGLVNLSAPWTVVNLGTDAAGAGSVGFTMPAGLVGAEVFGQGLDVKALERTTTLHGVVQ